MKKIIDLLVHWCSGALVLWCAILMALSFSGVSYGETIEDIFERARAKYLEFREIATDITILRTVTGEGETIEERIYKKGEMFRVERVEHEGTLVIEIYDGENFWRVIPERGIRQKLSREKGERRKDALLLENWFNFFYGKELKFDRRERLGDRDCYVLVAERLQDACGKGSLYLWIDRKTSVLLKLEGRGNEKETTITFSDFETIGGMEIPFSTEMRTNGRIVLSSLKLDIRTTLDPILFCAESIEIEDPLPAPPPPPPPLD